MIIRLRENTCVCAQNLNDLPQFLWFKIRSKIEKEKCILTTGSASSGCLPGSYSLSREGIHPDPGKSSGPLLAAFPHQLSYVFRDTKQGVRSWTPRATAPVQLIQDEVLIGSFSAFHLKATLHSNRYWPGLRKGLVFMCPLGRSSTKPLCAIVFCLCDTPCVYTKKEMPGTWECQTLALQVPLSGWRLTQADFWFTIIRKTDMWALTWVLPKARYCLCFLNSENMCSLAMRRKEFGFY